MLTRSSIAVALLVTSFACQPCQSQEDIFELASPFVGEAGDGWESDDVATLWYQQASGELRYYTPIVDDQQLLGTFLSLWSNQPVFKTDVVPPTLIGSFDQLTPTNVFKAAFDPPFADVDFGPLMQPDLDLDFFLSSVAVSLASSVDALPHNADIAVSTPEQPRPAPPVREPPPMIAVRRTPVLQPGDADRDGDFDRFDLIQAISSDKYQTGEPATWGEGDWIGAPGSFDPPPRGDGEFDRLDIVHAASRGLYQTGPYAEGMAPIGQSSPLVCCGEEDDESTSLVYDPETGEFALDAPFRQELTTLNIDSAAGIFTEEGAHRLRGPSAGVFDLDTDHTIFYARMGGQQSGATFGSFSLGRVAETDLSLDFLLNDLTALGSLDEQGLIESIDLVYRGDPSQQLKPGDADLDFKFDQLDLVKVLAAGKYLTGEPATWGDGDWDGAPARRRNEIPVGDGQFNQLDIVAALSGGIYLTGPYAALSSNGASNDNQTSVVYNAGTGEIAVDAPAGTELTSINIDSAAGIFTGEAAQNLGGSFDNDADGNIFKATFGSSFGSLSFGNVAQPGLAESFLLDDLTVVGSLQGGGALGDVDLIYVPEPSSIVLVVIGCLLSTARRRRVPFV